MRAMVVAILCAILCNSPLKAQTSNQTSADLEIKGGGSYYSGVNRAQDPFLELAITAPDAPVFQQCRGLLDKQNLVSNAIAIGGEGYFMSMPGAREKGLGIMRLDTITRCGLVPRR